MAVLTYDPTLKRSIRADIGQDLAVGTYPKLCSAIAERRATDARDLASFFVTEARVIYDIFTQWARDTLRYLADKGLADDVREREAARVRELAIAGRPVDLGDRDRAWTRLEQLAQSVKDSLDNSEAALETALTMKEHWRHMHDSDVDYLSGLFDIVIRTFGERALGEMYEGWVLGDWFATRYKRFDVSHFKWEEAFPLVVYLTFESMHGHLSGPGRGGDMTYEEFDDRVVFTFAPCGSGGREVVGEPLDGTPPRMEPPYRFKVLEEPHKFAWNKPGVCTYCVHCCVLTEKLPLEKFGYPIRVVDPPVYPNDSKAVCKWTVYRRPQDVPAAVYERLGYRKPGPDAELGSESWKGPEPL